MLGHTETDNMCLHTARVLYKDVSIVDYNVSHIKTFIQCELNTKTNFRSYIQKSKNYY